MGFLVRLTKTPATFQSFSLPVRIRKLIADYSPRTHLFVHFTDTNRIYGSFRPPLNARSDVPDLPSHRRGLPIPHDFYVPLDGPGRRSLSERQEEMLLADLAAVNRRREPPDLVNLLLSGRILTVLISSARPGPEVRCFRYPVDPVGLRRIAAETSACLHDLCLSNGKKPDGAEHRLKTSGTALFRKIFRHPGLTGYFRSRKGSLLSFFLPPELFHLPVEFCCLDDLFALSFAVSRVLSVTERMSGASDAFRILSVPTRGADSFCRKETETLTGLFLKNRKDATFAAPTRQSFERLYSSSRQIHFVGHGDFRKSRYLWFSEDRKLVMDPSAETCAPAPEFVFSSACNPGFFTGEFSSFLTGLFNAGLRAWIGPMTRIRRDSGFMVEAFYSRFLRSAPCAEALLAARKEAREKGDPSWAAFTLCGDPCYGLHREKKDFL